MARLVRSRPAPGSSDVAWDPVAGTIDAGALQGTEAVVHLAGEGIASRRWNAEHKRRVLDSRVQGTRLLSETLAKLDPRPQVLVSASAVGYYGDRGDETITEDSPPGQGFLAEVCTQWEAAAAAAVDAGIRVVHPRTGIVLSPEGGALKTQLPLFRFGLGGRLGSGRNWVPWISLDDEVGAIVHCIDHDLRGPVNLTAPSPVTNAEFTKALGRVLGRPTVVAAPNFALGIVLGREMAKELLLAGQRALPTRLQQSGYAFRHPELEGALRDLLGRDGPGKAG